MAYRSRMRGLSYGAAKSLIRKAVQSGKRSARRAGSRAKKGGPWLWVVLVAAVGGAVYFFKDKIFGPKKG